jgi:hypothetical protein
MPVTTSEASTTPAPANAAPPLDAEFAQLRKLLNAKVGVVITNVGPNPRPLVLGEWTSGPAWSTMKVPLTMTALREHKLTAPTDQMRAAITASDNHAAESIWEGLGDQVTATHKVEALLRTYGDPTMVQSRKIRPQFTAFGQSMWSLSDQARFIAGAVCDNGNAPILQLMGQVESEHHWGLGVVPESRFKGGWGPSESGSYLVRQLGVLKGPGGLTAVTIATEPASGALNDGTAGLTEIAKWLNYHLAELPAGRCGR